VRPIRAAEDKKNQNLIHSDRENSIDVVQLGIGFRETLGDFHLQVIEIRPWLHLTIVGRGNEHGPGDSERERVCERNGGSQAIFPVSLTLALRERIFEVVQARE
jgi:hypothetical protein